MGGHALKTITSKRMTRSEYNTIKREILDILKTHYIKVTVPFERPGKTDFGDLDVICLLDPTKGEVNPVQDIGSEECVTNGHIVSFAYKNYQVDLIHVNTVDEFEFATLFLSYGDVGMILGMMCKRMHLLMGHTELRVMTPALCLGRKILLTTDIWTALDFLGLSAERWQSGFFDVTDVFRWVTASRFFVPSTFSRQSMNKERRKRDKGRIMFKDFVTHCLEDEYCKKIADKPPMSVEDAFMDSTTYFRKTSEWDTLLLQQQKDDEVWKKLNGKLVMEWTGYRGQKLGQLMATFKENCTVDELLQMSEGSIKGMVLRLAVKQGDSP